jgi:hypothetical protein
MFNNRTVMIRNHYSPYKYFVHIPLQTPSRASFIAVYLKTLILHLPREATPHELSLLLKTSQSLESLVLWYQDVSGAPSDQQALQILQQHRPNLKSLRRFGFYIARDVNREATINSCESQPYTSTTRPEVPVRLTSLSFIGDLTHLWIDFPLAFPGLQDSPFVWDEELVQSTSLQYLLVSMCIKDNDISLELKKYMSLVLSKCPRSTSLKALIFYFHDFECPTRELLQWVKENKDSVAVLAFDRAPRPENSVVKEHSEEEEGACGVIYLGSADRIRMVDWSTGMEAIQDLDGSSASQSERMSSVWDMADEALKRRDCS